MTAAINRDRLQRASEQQAVAIVDRYATLSPREREVMARVVAGDAVLAGARFDGVDHPLEVFLLQVPDGLAVASDDVDRNFDRRDGARLRDDFSGRRRLCGDRRGQGGEQNDGKRGAEF